MGIMIIIHLNWGSILRDPHLMNHQTPRMSASSVEKNNLSMEVGLAPDKTSHGVLSIQANSWNIYRKPRFFFSWTSWKWDEMIRGPKASNFCSTWWILMANTPWCHEGRSYFAAGRACDVLKVSEAMGTPMGTAQISKLDIKAAGFRTGSLHWEDVVKRC